MSGTTIGRDSVPFGLSFASGGRFGSSVSVRISVSKDFKLSCLKSLSTVELGVASIFRGRFCGRSGVSGSGCVMLFRTLMKS